MVLKPLHYFVEGWYACFVCMKEAIERNFVIVCVSQLNTSHGVDKVVKGLMVRNLVEFELNGLCISGLL
jgi:hypothetical protein